MPSPRAIHLARDLETGRLIGADRAERQPKKGRYQCLDNRCGRFLTVAKSKRGKIHFKHFRELGTFACGLGGGKRSRLTHDAAQDLLVAVFAEAIQRRCPMPLLRFHTPSGVREVLPFVLAQTVVKEWTSPDRRRRADVALLDRDEEPVLLIEVFHTHAVDRNKRLDLNPYWWIEVEASDVLGSPFTLNVLGHGNLPYELEILGQQSELFERPTL